MCLENPYSRLQTYIVRNEYNIVHAYETDITTCLFLFK